MDTELRKQLVKNRTRRRAAVKEHDGARKELKKLVLKARDMKVPMTRLAVVTGVDRRTLYDILGNDRASRIGAGKERN